MFQLIGTTYGGDGQSTFALPNLQSRVPIHQGNGFVLAEQGGVETVTLTVNQIPVHSHSFLATTDIATQAAPAGSLVAQPSVAKLYFAAPGAAVMAPTSIGATGGGQPHDNIQPYLTINFIISLFGIFPSPS